MTNVQCAVRQLALCLWPIHQTIHLASVASVDVDLVISVALVDVDSAVSGSSLSSLSSSRSGGLAVFGDFD
ncbi:hypothetical protein [Thermosinus carboxydivorans]|nr:hypothetical protein [Thermosinus carboxydivorans]